MASRRRDRESRYERPGPPASLGSSLAAHVALIATCRTCGHQARPDLAGLVARYGADLDLLDWGRRLRCSQCGSRAVDSVVSGYHPPSDYWT